MESDHEKRLAHLLAIRPSDCMRRPGNQRWLSRHWNKFDGSKSPEYSLAKVKVVSKLFRQYLIASKTAMAYVTENKIDDAVLNHDVEVFVTAKIWDWKTNAGAIADENIRAQAAVIAVCRQMQSELFRAVGYEFKAVHTAVKALPESDTDLKQLTEVKKACLDEVAALTESLRSGLTKSLEGGCPKELSEYLLPEINNEDIAA